MRTVKEVSQLTGVSIRTLHYYDEIGLLSPTSITDTGYRLYDDTALERLQHIMLFREFGIVFPDELMNISVANNINNLETIISSLLLDG